jgi:3-deoxy-D-manno-octulosonate cytidylyltransferase
MTTSENSLPRGGCRSQIVIPARLASTRLPRKLLLRETGKSVLQHTYESASRAAKPRGVCVAADHEEIAEEVRRFGGQVFMTDPAAASGTDRVAEVARQMADVEIVVNVQGDEPEIAGAGIDLAIQLLEDHPTAVMSTLATPIRTREQLDEPSCVKVVFDSQRRALYFSRSPIPHARQWDDALLADNHRISTSTWVCMRTAANSCCGWPRSLDRTWRNWKAWSSFESCRQAFSSSSGRRRAHDRHRHRERLPGICQTDSELLRCSSRAAKRRSCLSRFFDRCTVTSFLEIVCVMSTTRFQVFLRC